jgi:hypothetical protein
VTDEQYPAAEPPTVEVHAEWHAYTAHHLTVTRYKGAVGPEATP